jgi:predicted PurR-regulated permease PerM
MQGGKMAISGWIQQRRSLIFLFVLLAAILPILLQIAWPFLTSFIVASVIAIIVHPAKERLSRRIHRPGLATFLATLAIVSLLGIFLAITGFTLTREVTAVYDSFNQRSLEEGGWPALVTKTVDKTVDGLAKRLPIDKQAIEIELTNGMKTISSYLLSKIGIAVGEATNFVITGFLVTIFLYFLLKYGKGWVDRLAALSPLDDRAAATIIGTIHDSVVANVISMLAVVLGQGFLLTLGFWFVGVHSPVLWGALGGIASIIPVIGGLLIWGPVVIGYAIMGAYGKALALGLWCVLIVGSADNVLRPLVVGSRSNQHPILVALAAIGGTYAFGALGILLGPLMVSLVAALLKEIQLLMAAKPAGESRQALAGNNSVEGALEQ